MFDSTVSTSTRNCEVRLTNHRQKEIGITAKLGNNVKNENWKIRRVRRSLNNVEVE